MAHAPENTVESFEKAITLGCDEIETDVWLADDGRLVISHDRPIPGTRHLTLDDVLDLCRGRIAVNVEVKDAADEDHARRAGSAVAARISARKDPDAYLSSFWWSALAGARDAAPDVRRAFIFSGSPDRPALVASARALGLWALHPNHVYVTAELVAAAHTAALQVNAWTANEPADIARLVALRIDGICSNWPERVPKG